MTLIHTSMEEVVIDMLQRTGPCCLDDLVRYLPHLSWGQIYVAVDRMSRHGQVFLHQLGYSTYRVTLSSQLASSPLYHLARRRAYDSSIPPRERTPIQLQSSSE
jgi:hypothetical protein